MGGQPMLKPSHMCDTLALDDGVHVPPSFIPWPNSEDGCNKITVQIIPISQKEYVKQDMDCTFIHKANNAKKMGNVPSSLPFAFTRENMTPSFTPLSQILKIWTPTIMLHGEQTPLMVLNTRSTST